MYEKFVWIYVVGLLVGLAPAAEGKQVKFLFQLL